jgi:hypothetical protein
MPSVREWPTTATFVVIGVQFGVGLPLLAEPLRHPAFRTYFFYYGVIVLVLPFVLDLLGGRWLHPAQRLALVAAPCAHAYGVLLQLYGRFAWWDVVTHGLSAGLLAAGAYLVLDVLTDEDDERDWRFHAVPFVVVLVGGVGWEVYEMVVPWLVVYGPLDTARDLAVDVLAWAVVARTYPAILGETGDGIRRRVRRLRDGNAST